MKTVEKVMEDIGDSCVDNAQAALEVLIQYGKLKCV